MPDFIERKYEMPTETPESLTVEVCRKDGLTNLVFFPREQNQLLIAMSNDACKIFAERLLQVVMSPATTHSSHWTFDLVESNLPPDDDGLDNQEWRD